MPASRLAWLSAVQYPLVAGKVFEVHQASDSVDAQANSITRRCDSEFDKAMVVATLKGARERKRTLTSKKVEVPERSGYVCSFEN